MKAPTLSLEAVLGGVPAEGQLHQGGLLSRPPRGTGTWWELDGSVFG